MPSTYTTSGIELIANGEQSGAWGDTTNLNLQIIDRLTSQAGAISLSGTTHTLTVSDGLLSDGQYGVLVFGGSPTGTNTVTISPNDAKRTFIVKNGSGETVTLTQGSGSDVDVGDGRTAIVYCDGAGAGAAVVNVSDAFVSAALDDIGALAPTDGNFIVGNGTTWVTETGDTALASLGVTATTAELNILDGATVTTAELNYNDITTLGTSEASKVVTADANGDVTLAAELVAESYNETFDTVTSTTNATTIDCETGNVFLHTLTENTTFIFSNPPSSGTAYGFTLKLVQDATARTVTWPASVDWAGGEAPTISSGSGEVDVFVFFTHDGGTNWYGFTAGQVMS